MIIKECLRCKGDNLSLADCPDIVINSHEERDGAVFHRKSYRKIVSIICNDCGHIELFTSIDKVEKE